MSWKDQPREPKGSPKGGQWKSDKLAEAEYIYNSDPPNYRQNTSYRDILRLPDEVLPRSVGAKWSNHKISLPNGGYANFVEGSKLQNKEVFAGKGCRRKIDCIDCLVRTYGGHPNEWMKVKAIGEIRLPSSEIVKAELHWYEEPSVGKVEIKYKREL